MTEPTKTGVGAMGWFLAAREASEMWNGPFQTREAAIDAGRDDHERESFWICRASSPPLRLADWMPDADNLLEQADDQLAESDRVGSDGDEGPWFEVKPDLVADLDRRIKAACDDWQAAHGAVFTCTTFETMRDFEQVPEIPTRAYLAQELRDVAARAGADNAAVYEALAARAETGEFDDFGEAHDCGLTALHGELMQAGLTKFAQRVANGEFDATLAESDAWAASPAGQAAFARLPDDLRRALGDPSMTPKDGGPVE